MNYAYIRVSTEKQTTENQKLAIETYCHFHQITKIHFISENISGTKLPSKRKLGNLIDVVQPGDLIIVTELSRLGRSLMMILDTLQTLLEKNVKVIAIKEGYELGDNIQSKVLAFAFGLSAEIERNLISERTKQGLDRARKEGKHLGRYKGQRPSKYKLTGKESYILWERHKGTSKSELARRCDVTWVTMNNYMKNHEIL